MVSIIQWIAVMIPKRDITPRGEVCNVNGSQSAAARESFTADARHAVGDGDGGQAVAARESRSCNSRCSVFYNYFRIIRHSPFIFICYIPCIHHAVWLIIIPWCVIESRTADACHAVGDGDGCQAAAARESAIIDGCHAVGDGDGCQSAAAIESKTADACHAVGDGDGCQAAAARESVIIDGCHAVGDGDGCQAAAAIVFATHCVPARFGLNGRKVIAWILWMEKMMKN